MSSCPTCGQRIPPSRPIRICAKCEKQILRMHKWCFITTGKKTTIQHRNCDNPNFYSLEHK